MKGGDLRMGVRCYKATYRLRALSEYPEMMQIQDVSNYFGVTRDTVYRWIKAGQIDSIKIGRIWFVPRESIERIKKCAP